MGRRPTDQVTAPQTRVGCSIKIVHFHTAYLLVGITENPCAGVVIDPLRR